jgi:hypothetical protein
VSKTAFLKAVGGVEELVRVINSNTVRQISALFEVGVPGSFLTIGSTRGIADAISNWFESTRQTSVGSFSTRPPPSSSSTVAGGIALLWDEAAELLKTSTNWDEILLVLRFIPLDRTTTMGLLSRRWRPILDTWLNFLHGSRTRPHCDSNERAATEIVDTVNQRYFPAVPPWDAEWLFSSMESSVATAVIADRFDLGIRTVLCWTPYERWAFLALGLEDNVALNFLNAIESFNARCVDHVRTLEILGKGTEKWHLLAEVSLSSLTRPFSY